MMSRIYRYAAGDDEKDADPVDIAINTINKMLQLGGTHDFSGSKNKGFTHLSVLLLCVTTCSFVYVGEASQWYHLLQQWPDKDEVMKALDCLVTCFIPLSELLWIMMQKSRMKELFQMAREGYLSIPKDSVAGKSIRSTLRKGRILIYFITISFLLTHVLFVGLPLILSFALGKNYFPEIPGEFMWLKPRLVSPNFELSYFFVSIGVWFSAINVSGYTIIFITFMAHMLGHIYGINDTLKSLRDQIEENANLNANNQFGEEISKVTFDTLKLCIKRHQFVLKYHAKVDDMYKIIFGFHFFLMTIISVTTVQTMGEWGVINTVITASVSFMPLIMYCFGGEMVISANDGLVQAAYDSNWERMSRSHAKLILFIICAAQRPIHFKAGNLIVLNVETFGTVMETVYKFIAILR